MILCLRPLPAANGGWNSAKWRTPKLAAPVSVRPAPLIEWLTALALPARTELHAILTAPFVAALRLEAPTTAFETAIAYAGVVAEACAGVIILGEELTADCRASVTVWSGPQIEERWRAIDAEAARAEPGYQPVLDLNDDHRPTQSFAFPIGIDGIDGIETSAPTSLTVYEAALSAMTAPEPPAGTKGAAASAAAASASPVAAPTNVTPAERRAIGSAPPSSSASGGRITVTIPPLASASPDLLADDASPPRSLVPEPSGTPLDPADDEKTYDAIFGNDDDWSDVMPE
jgi:hypothetical protein